MNPNLNYVGKQDRQCPITPRLSLELDPHIVSLHQENQDHLLSLWCDSQQLTTSHGLVSQFMSDLVEIRLCFEASKLKSIVLSWGVASTQKFWINSWVTDLANFHVFFLRFSYETYFPIQSTQNHTILNKNIYVLS